MKLTERNDKLKASFVNQADVYVAMVFKDSVINECRNKSSFP